MLHKAVKACLTFYLTLMIAAVGLLGLSQVTTLPFGIRFVPIETGSMEPAMPIGSLVIVKASQAFTTGDVIAFAPAGQSSTLVTHRIAEIQGNRYITKGDANSIVDGGAVSDSAIAGKPIVSLPFVGDLLAYVLSVKGSLLLLVMPGLLLMLWELGNLGKRPVGVDWRGEELYSASSAHFFSPMRWLAATLPVAALVVLVSVTIIQVFAVQPLDSLRPHHTAFQAAVYYVKLGAHSLKHTRPYSGPIIDEPVAAGAFDTFEAIPLPTIQGRGFGTVKGQ